MSYEPTEWENGDIITAEKLNKIENGIANNGILIVGISDDTLDKTWQEIHEAGFSVLYDSNDKQYIQVECYEDTRLYKVSYWTYDSVDTTDYTTDSPTSYPVLKSKEVIL